MRVLSIVEGTSVDGPGLRTSVYLAGCTHQCPECHNPQSWDISGGEDMSVECLLERIIENEEDVTFSGGDPLMQIDDGLLDLCQRLKALHPSPGIWLYTGYTFEAVRASENLSRILPLIDVMVDGRYIRELRNTELLFRGSSNQRIIDVAASLAKDKAVEWKSDFAL